MLTLPPLTGVGLGVRMYWEHPSISVAALAVPLGTGMTVVTMMALVWVMRVVLKCTIYTTKLGSRSLRALLHKERTVQNNVTSFMLATKRNPYNANSRKMFKQSLLRKYGLNTNNQRAIERRYFIHLQRIPMSDKRKHAELKLARDVAFAIRTRA